MGDLDLWCGGTSTLGRDRAPAWAVIAGAWPTHASRPPTVAVDTCDQTPL